MDYSKTIEKVKPNIALVYVTKDNNVLGKGSGFVYGKSNILVTCNHVVMPVDANVSIQFPGSAFINATVAMRDEEHDLALLKFDDPTRIPLKAAEIEEIKEGMAVIFSGYPLSLQDLTTHQGILSAIIKDAAGVTNYLIDGTVNVGNSGCPLMTSDGKVVGVVNAMRRERSDLLNRVEVLNPGALSLHGIDLIEIYQAIIKNVQLGMGYAIPCSYIPKHHDPEIKVKKVGK